MSEECKDCLSKKREIETLNVMIDDIQGKFEDIKIKFQLLEGAIEDMAKLIYFKWPHM